MMATATTPTDREIVVTREFDAPRELVWEAWTNPAHVVRWWGPFGFTTTSHEMDVRVGDIWRLTMHGPDGTDYPNKSRFTVVQRPERIEYEHGGGRKGGPGHSFHVAWMFEARDEKTLVTMRLLFATREERDLVIGSFGAVEGGKQTLARLAEHLAAMAQMPSCTPTKHTSTTPQGHLTMKNSLKLTTPGDREILITRSFDAPRRMVWDAMTRPELLKRWLFLPPGWVMTECHEDVRVGGTYRWAWNGPDGKQVMSMHGTYREVMPHERIVRTETFDMGCQPQMGEQLATMRLSEDGPSRTTVTISVIYPSKTARDGAAASGMEQGMAAGYDKMETLLAQSAC